jgi:quercetin dioxygenase-like cupin family protein
MCPGSSAIARLRELAEKLPPLPVDVMSGNRVDVDVTAGSAIGVNLLSSPHVSVLTWTLVPGTVYQPHAHAEREWIIVVSGKMRIVLAEMPHVDRLVLDDSGWFVLTAGDYLLIPPGVAHEAVFDVFTEVVTVHIPRSGDYSPYLTRTRSADDSCQGTTPVTGESTAGSSLVN